MASEATGLGGIAERYATALYELAEADKQLDTVAGDLGGIKAMIGELERFAPADPEPAASIATSSRAPSPRCWPRPASPT